MGSRRWNLSYPESDIDATIICDDKEFHSQILDQLEIYYEVNYPAIPNSSYKKLKTLANLHLFVIDPFEESELHMPIKLEYSIQTVQQNQTIINHVTKELAKMSLLDKSEYAVKMREMYLTKDELGKARLKAFLKCL
jgi:response regulator RpfG family c-di-GMP phosphodiesterase